MYGVCLRGPPFLAPLLKPPLPFYSYSALNPMQQLPTLECRDLATGQTVALTQSLPIMEFLDEAFPEVIGACVAAADGWME